MLERAHTAGLSHGFDVALGAPGSVDGMAQLRYAPPSPASLHGLIVKPESQLITNFDGDDQVKIAAKTRRRKKRRQRERCWGVGGSPGVVLAEGQDSNPG